jgi:ER membrane protein complex subunit 4
VDTIAPKLLFIALNLAAMGLGIWKVSSFTCLVIQSYLVFL